VQAGYNVEVQRRLAQSVWNAGCNNWYLNEAGKNTNNWPGLTLEYWWKTRRVNWAIYKEAELPNPAIGHSPSLVANSGEAP
jgi:hypothetical protein